MNLLFKLIENEINKIEIQNLRKYNGYLTSFMSDQFMKRSGMLLKLNLIYRPKHKTLKLN